MKKSSNGNSSSLSSWGDIRSTPKKAPKEKNIRSSETMNVGYGGQKQSSIPKFTLDVRQDTPLYKQGNDEYKNREVLPNYINSNPNDNG